MKRTARVVVCQLLTTFLLAGWGAVSWGQKDTTTEKSRYQQTYSQLPLRFEPNQGQTDPRVKFMARGNGYGLFLTAREIVVQLQNGNEAAPASSVIRLQLRGANLAPRITGLNALAGQSNYLIGAGAKDWQLQVPGYEKVRYQQVYPGIDVIYYGQQRQLEYDFVVAPGASPAQIKMRVQGAPSLCFAANGDLLLQEERRELRLKQPLAYQEINGERRPVEIAYQLDANQQISFRLGKYDRRYQLVIDPVLSYATYLGGVGQEQGLGIAVDKDGQAYVVGSTTSARFPGTSASLNGGSDAFVAKLNPAGTELVYATYLGGLHTDTANAVAVDAAGQAYVTGGTSSANFPVSADAVQKTMKGVGDAFIAKLNPTGTGLLYATYLGGNNFESALSLAIDNSGNAYVAGQTDSTDFPTLGLPTVRTGAQIYKSLDNAGTWAASNTGLTARTLLALVADPANANTIYGTGANGLYKTTDGGATWSLLSTAQLSGISLAIDPKNPATIYWGGATLLKSTDGGATFVPKATGLGNPLAINSLLVHPTTPTTIYAGTFFGAFKSTDGGETWAPINRGLTDNPNGGTGTLQVKKLALSAADPSILYAGTNRGVFRTIDGGVNWTPVNIGLLGGTSFSGPDIQALTVDPTNANKVLVGINSSQGANFVSLNGGGTWSVSDAGLRDIVLVGTNRGYVFPQSYAFDPVSAAIIYIGTPFGVFKSTDGGSQWARMNTGLGNLRTTGLLIIPGAPATIFVATSPGTDGFAAKLNANGSAMQYSLYLGGNETDTAYSIAVDSGGNAWIAGRTDSFNFPTTANALNKSFGWPNDGFVTKLNATGTAMLHSTYLGGTANDEARGIALDAAGNAYVTGFTSSTNFPLVNSLQPRIGGATDVFLAKMKADGSALDFSSVFGGGLADQAFAIALDKDGNPAITGQTSSVDFPRIGSLPHPQLPGPDAFVAKLNSAGTKILYSTYLGGSTGTDVGSSVAVDTTGNVYVAGTTSARDFPLTITGQSLQGPQDAFVAKLIPGTNLSLAMTGESQTVFGNNLTYNITIRNNGELDATGVKLTDVLPAGATLVSASASQGSCSGAGTVNCALGNLANGALATVTVVISPPAVPTISNTATVSADQPDPNPADNSATITTQITFADLAVTNAAPLERALAGGKVTWLVTVTNKAGTTSGPITVIYTLPLEATYLSCGVEGGDCGGIGNNVVATIPSLAVGESKAIAFTAKLKDDLAKDTMISSTAAVSSVTPDPDKSNNVASGSITIVEKVVTPKANGKILFISDRAFTGSTQPSGTYMINPDGTGETYLPNIWGAPTWSPDGAKVAFVGVNEQGDSSRLALYVANLDGSGKIKIASNVWNYFPHRFSWSPDGKKIVYVDLPDRYIYLANVDGSGQTRLPGSPSWASNTDWSPDGTKIAYEKDNDIWVMNLDGSEKTKLTSRPNGAYIRYMLPRWSPDGSKLLFERRTNNFYDAWVMNADGTGATRLFNLHNSTFPAWSPDGTKIAFVSLNSLHVINLDGTNLVRLVKDWYNYSPDWQPLPTNNPPPPPPAVKLFTISGKITYANGTPYFGQVTLSGTSSGTIVTEEDPTNSGYTKGEYTFVRLPEGGNYTITIPDRRLKAEPVSRTYNDLKASQTGADFVVTPLTYTISGRVVDKDGKTVDGLQVGLFVNANLSARAETDSAGNYSFKNVGAGGTYTVYPISYPSLTSASEPGFITFAELFADQTANFVVTRALHPIRGKALDENGNGLSGVTVTLSGGREATATTDSTGAYSFADVPAAFPYTVTATKTATTFCPASRQISRLAGAREINFISGISAATTVSGASYRTEPVALDSIVSLFGEGLASTTKGAASLPLPTELEGTSIMIQDSAGSEVPAQLLYVSPLQINYIIPYFFTPGEGLVKVMRNNRVVASGIVELARLSPSLFAANADGKGAAAAAIVFVKSGQRSSDSAYTCDAQGKNCTTKPIDLDAADEVFVELYGTGIRGYNGQLNSVTATVGGISVPVLYAWHQCCFIGLDQVNLQLPKTLRGRGEVEVILTIDGKTANPVKLNFK